VYYVVAVVRRMRTTEPCKSPMRFASPTECAACPVRMPAADSPSIDGEWVGAARANIDGVRSIYLARNGAEQGLSDRTCRPEATSRRACYLPARVEPGGRGTHQHPTAGLLVVLSTPADGRREEA